MLSIHAPLSTHSGRSQIGQDGSRSIPLETGDVGAAILRGGDRKRNDTVGFPVMCTDQFKEVLLESVNLAEGCHVQP